MSFCFVLLKLDGGPHFKDTRAAFCSPLVLTVSGSRFEGRVANIPAPYLEVPGSNLRIKTSYVVFYHDLLQLL
jgi:hypothetical protein